MLKYLYCCTEKLVVVGEAFLFALFGVEIFLRCLVERHDWILLAFKIEHDPFNFFEDGKVISFLIDVLEVWLCKKFGLHAVRTLPPYDWV